MRAVVTRVTAAHVEVDDQIVGRLDLEGGAQGLVALVGVTHDDTDDTANALADKVWRLRILDGERSAADLDAPILVISQFTLYANVTKGRRPSWNAAAPGAVAEPVVDRFTTALSDLGATVATGRFGAHMRVHSVNDGPVTILIEM
ncbi:MAG: D-aminoacyl-tRNA deacylase [Corynebacteriales bacterium]|uniref:D-aminoacyl-tRNA deacylase n=1 Tax=Williamsia herbipolensis TaxID=1603258 RepID=A0AAU4K666_9NOCA|nr:D-aminoacyl-tRNA deacylase [Williamsia herbipolensis]MCX6471730.1 D-aminoacyl-tRNA deacylase [Mycobacteriales bacterium]